MAPATRLKQAELRRNEVKLHGTSEGSADWPCLGTRARRRIQANRLQINTSPQLTPRVSRTENRLDYPCLGTRSRRKLLTTRHTEEPTISTRGKQNPQKENVLTLQETLTLSRITHPVQRSTALEDCDDKLHVIDRLNETPRVVSYHKGLAPKTCSKKKVNTVYAPRKKVAHVSRRSKRKLHNAQVLAEQELAVTCYSGPNFLPPAQSFEQATTPPSMEIHSQDYLKRSSSGLVKSERQQNATTQSALSLSECNSPAASSYLTDRSELAVMQKLKQCQARAKVLDTTCSAPEPSQSLVIGLSSIAPPTSSFEESKSGKLSKSVAACSSQQSDALKSVDLFEVSVANTQACSTSKQELRKLLTATLASRMKKKLASKPFFPENRLAIALCSNKTSMCPPSATSVASSGILQQQIETVETNTEDVSLVDLRTSAETSAQFSSVKNNVSQMVSCLAPCETSEQEVPLACSSKQKIDLSQRRKLLTSILATRLKQKLSEPHLHPEPDALCSKPTITVNLASQLKLKLNSPSHTTKQDKSSASSLETSSDVGQLATETLAFRLKQIINSAQTEEGLNARLCLEDPGPSTSSHYIHSKRKRSEESNLKSDFEDAIPKRCKSCSCPGVNSYVQVKCKTNAKVCIESESNTETSASSTTKHNVVWDVPSTSKSHVQDMTPSTVLDSPKVNREPLKDSILKHLETVLMAAFRKRFVSPPPIPAPVPLEPVTPASLIIGPSNFMTYQYINERTLGSRSSKIVLEPVFSPVVNHLSQLTVYKTASPFDRRATAMAWHPTCPSSLAVASKGGDIILWNFESARHDLFIPGIGAGGSVLAMKFHAHDPTLLYTAALDGKVCLQDFQGKNSRVILDTMNWDQWFCSLDVSVQERMLVAGDSLGNVTLMTNYGEKAWSFRLHRSKVSHVEFSPRESWLLATTSIDSTLKIWDIRNVKNRDSALHVCRHDKPVNSAYFSLQNGTRILTTDQHSELRIYKGPLWNLERVIPHPHRQFQHLTPIKAHWHPLVDVAVVGRYPDEHFPGYVPGERRSVDFFSAESGNMSFQLTEQGVVGIISLNQFNNTGEVLASCMGYNILIWKNKDEVTAQRLLQHQNSAKQVRYFKTAFYQRPQRSRQDENNSSGMNTSYNNSSSGNETNRNSNSNLSSSDVTKRKCVRSLLVDNKNLNLTLC